MFQSGVTGLLGSLGAVSKIVLFLLFLASVISWGVIFLKWKSFRSADREDQRFFSAFTKIRDLDELYRQSKRAEGSPSAQVFQGMMDRVGSVSADGHHGIGSKDPMQVLDRQYLDKTVGYLVQNQVSQLESYLPILATTGNITPFIGLLGTVLGIIDSFREIGLQGTASIAAVAPGVSEALVATAAGLFTAIPAVIAYNYFLTRIRRMVFRIESFTVEAMRSLQTRPKPTAVGMQG
ncbi:MAG TPA: MotA/TolQ/ExbB proton channel family protein [Nitrospiraceae bacterium]|jgi:biopolymer transport protein TolQ|nr:MotA/TolQ/ExbB proton channel family protein [Nitrospiraceae bacterium]